MIERPVSIEAGDRFKVQILVDGSTVEAFVNDQLAMSYRAYHTGGPVLFGFLAEDVTVSFEEVHVSK
jgi:sucrose-6-phosphate hydrolase SacC (GH32 family)